MMTRVRVTRRRVLRILVGLSALASLRPAYALATLGTSRTTDPIALSLAKLLTHKESAKIVGLEYLRCVPKESDVRLLIDLICSSQAERRAELAQADAGKLRELLLAQQCRDFEYGRIVKVQGWVLSETEARLCAIVALL